ncbi:MAG: hypothetical protein H6515_12960 [Microthrixaceae bacterium]|nr:hypothetical protein [Microthrixaceae bacterium]
MTSTNPLGVPAHQHPNGGGWVADAAHVAAHVYVGPDARIGGGTIWGGTIRGGTIEGGTIGGGTIGGGTIGGGTIWGGTIGGGTIRHTRDLLVIGPVGSEDQHATLVRCDTDRGEGTGHRLTIGCWNGEHTVDDLAAEVRRRCPDRADEYAEVEAVLRRRVAEWESEAAS